jgi:hypothetical protein
LLRKLLISQNINNFIADEYDEKYVARHIPIFMFSLDYELPVFIDKYYTSKALSDMVIIVQSNFHSWESRVACNDKPIYLDLR